VDCQQKCREQQKMHDARKTWCLSLPFVRRPFTGIRAGRWR
jgi:hypothetical protein